jgi:hypothetical protein
MRLLFTNPSREILQTRQTKSLARFQLEDFGRVNLRLKLTIPSDFITGDLPFAKFTMLPAAAAIEHHSCTNSFLLILLVLRRMGCEPLCCLLLSIG